MLGRVSDDEPTMSERTARSFCPTHMEVSHLSSLILRCEKLLTDPVCTVTEKHFSNIVKNDLVIKTKVLPILS